jgi:hypothetical protein
MVGFFTNMLVLAFAFLTFANQLLFDRPFETSGAPSAAIMVALAHVLVPVELPTLCCSVRVRLFPFFSLSISAAMALFSKPDGLIATAFATVLSYVYIRYQAGGRSARGPRVDFRRLVTDWTAPESMSGSGGSAEDREAEARIPAGLLERDATSGPTPGEAASAAWRGLSRASSRARRGPSDHSQLRHVWRVHCGGKSWCFGSSCSAIER